MNIFIIPNSSYIARRNIQDTVSSMIFTACVYVAYETSNQFHHPVYLSRIHDQSAIIENLTFCAYLIHCYSVIPLCLVYCHIFRIFRLVFIISWNKYHGIRWVKTLRRAKRNSASQYFISTIKGHWANFIHQLK